ncbi:MAG: hypothetical protein ACI4OS_02185 [Akkermansia sp.]
MSPTSAQRKQELLTRLATTRLGALDALAELRVRARQRVGSLRVSGNALRLGAAGLVGLAGARLLMHRRAPVAASPASPLRRLALQLLSAVLLPMAQQYLLSRMPQWRDSCVRSVSSFSLPTPAELFYRWLGLIK